ncbi:FAD-binding oxidoreductase [bacterium]|nr:MAG: FAD-binding oxidoreductase [bacterium]
MKSAVVVVGGGFFGARVALEFARAGHEVTLLEREAGLMKRASYANQARVHGGYHYPRSLLTALRSRVNLPAFYDEYRDCIDTSFEKYYVIARQFSKVSYQQFGLFCQRIEAPVRPAPDRVTKLFNDDLVEAVYTVEEYAFNATAIAERLTKQLTDVGVRIETRAEVLAVGPAAGGLVVRFQQHGQERELTAQRVFNCTYARINEINRRSGVAELPLKHEIAEIVLIEPPAELADKGVTVMCGPFFSTMPFPARGLHSLTHVRYTPHTEWHEAKPDSITRDSYDYLDSLSLPSAYPKMLADAQRYLPSLADSKYVESLFEVKTVLPQSEGDDSRPILYKPDHGGLTGYTCIMGGKLDNIYDVLKELEG